MEDARRLCDVARSQTSSARHPRILLRIFASKVNDILAIISSLWPVVVGLVTLIIVLARMHYNIESLTEKVKVLFDFHNKRNDK